VITNRQFIELVDVFYLAAFKRPEDSIAWGSTLGYAKQTATDHPFVVASDYNNQPPSN
jgi:hypothetical protein